MLPGLREQDGFEGVLVLSTAEGQGMIVTLWATEDGARRPGAASPPTELERFVTIFRSPPGREYYDVAVAELPARRVSEVAPMQELFGIPVERAARRPRSSGSEHRARAARGARRSATRSWSSSRVATSAGGAGRTALIVVGLMLGTTIIAAALTTGDTMSHTIRPTAVRRSAHTDETVAAKGADG